MSPLKLTDRRRNQTLLQHLAKLDFRFDTKSTHHILTVNQKIRSHKKKLEVKLKAHYGEHL